ncbi:MAG: hypothetical protein R3C26_21935 [Calditrichia bacterium]
MIRKTLQDAGAVSMKALPDAAINDALAECYLPVIFPFAFVAINSISIDGNFSSVKYPFRRCAAVQKTLSSGARTGEPIGERRWRIAFGRAGNVAATGASGCRGNSAGRRSERPDRERKT